MTTGLKQLVEQAMAAATEQVPVEVSDEARHAIARKMREWAGWPDAKIVFGDPRPVSPFASCDHVSRTFTANIDRLILNPHRVLLTVTPFRLRQEAVLTGCLLHEAGHARHSLWRPRTREAAAKFVHGSGSVHEGEPVTAQTTKLATLLEEPRVEGLMARNAGRVGADGLGWTMRAASAELLPFTGLSTDPDQRVMDLITSWALRAGKQIAYANWVPGYNLPRWVADLTSLLHGVLIEHLVNANDDDAAASSPTRDAQKIIDQLVLMALCVDDRGTYMVDSARDILDILFPETDGNDPDAPQAGEGCTMQKPEDEEQSEPGESGGSDESGEGDDDQSQAGDEESEGEGDESGEGGKGDTEPEDEGSGTEPGEGDSGSDEVSESSDTGDSNGPVQEGDQGGTQGSSDNAGVDSDSDLAKALASLESKSKDQTEEEADEKSQQTGGEAGGDGGEGTPEGKAGFRMPSKEERDIQHGADKFIRAMIEPSESSRVTLTDTPSSTIDGTAYEAWAAGGKIRAPHFFKQTRRTVEPSPPVKIAILVDVSASMDDLQDPSAVLSWALASAALDLRNFAGRGQQIESCLIHWGSSARVVQEVNAPIPGVQVYDCNEWTTAWPAAMDLVEEQMPTFFDIPMVPVNRLIVNFTDWQFGSSSRNRSTNWMAKAMASGVNMLSVVPSSYSVKRSNLSDFLAAATTQRSRHGLIKYNPTYPGQVWDTAAEMLDGGNPAPFAGF